ncbi:hypothetical protein EYV94_28470, partial [Puteibacter caeruleilacunae]
ISVNFTDVTIKTQILLSNEHHNGKPVIAVRFKYDQHIIARHLLEHAVDTRYIQSPLAHGSTKTTEIYTHISNKSLAKINSPLDEILNDKKE